MTPPSAYTWFLNVIGCHLDIIVSIVQWQKRTPPSFVFGFSRAPGLFLRNIRHICAKNYLLNAHIREIQPEHGLTFHLHAGESI